MIDIIIPAYNAHSHILNTLYSIASQTISNSIKVYLVDDCSIKHYHKEIKKVEKILNITELKTPKNIGFSGARQYGIDNSNSKYIIFIDPNDLFNNGLSVKLLYDCINDNNYNVVSSNFYQENKNSFNYYYGDIGVYGKIYRRNFLINNNIRFDVAYSNNDIELNKLVICNELNYLNVFTYIRKYNSNCITKNNDFESKIIDKI